MKRFRMKEKSAYFFTGLTILAILSTFLLIKNLEKPAEVKFGRAAESGDCDGDGFVDLFDYGYLSRSFGLTQGQPGFDGRCDFHVDQFNIIDLFDYQILANNFGRNGPTNTLTPRPSGPTPTIHVPPQGSGMWISRTELNALPTSGAAWENLRSNAYGSWGTPDLKNQDNKFGLKVLAGALVYARTGDATLRSKVRDGIISAKRTMDNSSEWGTTNGVLSLGRQLGAFVISADLIDFRNFDSTAEGEFRNWLNIIRTTNVGTHSRWYNLKRTSENSANNWGSFALPSRIAAGIYLGDSADVQRSANVFRAYLGERQYYPSDAPGQNGYFEPSAGWDRTRTWACNEAVWTGVNGTCTKSGVNIDGNITDDVSRGGNCCTPVGDGIMYSWEALQGISVSAELLHRQGYDSFNWSNKAFKRAIDFMQRNGWHITSPAPYVPWIANKRYGTNYPTSTTGSGRIMSWTDWTHSR